MRRAAILVAGGIAALAVAAAGTAGVQALITGAPIKDGTIESRDVKNGAIGRPPARGCVAVCPGGAAGARGTGGCERPCRCAGWGGAAGPGRAAGSRRRHRRNGPAGREGRSGSGRRGNGDRCHGRRSPRRSRER